MTTTVVDPRPDLIAEEAAPNQPILADTFLRIWRTIGNAYEKLTAGIAPGNGGRTVPAPHDHGVVGPGVFVAQAMSRWQGSAELGSQNAPATAHPFALPATYVWAAVVNVYADQEAMVVIFGSTGDAGLGNPAFAQIAGRLFLEIDGLDTPYEVVQSQDPGAWSIFAGLGKMLAGVHTLALRLGSYSAEGESWTVEGAEVWHSGGDQMTPPP